MTHNKAYLDSYSFMTSVCSLYGQLGNSMSTSPDSQGLGLKVIYQCTVLRKVNP
jgi:hypothetical protein